jgi:hypothetical protein
MGRKMGFTGRTRKIERWHRTLKSECIRPGVPLSLEDARRLVEGYVRHYNEVRLHNAIGYVTPAAKLAGLERAIFAERDRKLEVARERRRIARTAARRAEGSEAVVSDRERPYDGGHRLESDDRDRP